MAVHDYLHVWCTRLIQSVQPELRFGVGPITADTIDAHVFCCLVAEAAATTGLDYWYLCTLDVNDVVPIGSALTGGLTVRYHENHAREYARFFQKRLDVQTPQFFDDLCRFYCTGEFLGVGPRSVARSPLLAAWLEHEVTYAVAQRLYTRRWLRYLAGADPEESRGDRLRVTCSRAWQHALIATVREALWALIKQGVDVKPEPCPLPTWSRPEKTTIHFAFTNWNSLRAAERRSLPQRIASSESFEWWFYQYVSQLDSDGADALLSASIPLILRERDTALAITALTKLRALEGSQREIRDVFLLN